VADDSQGNVGLIEFDAIGATDPDRG